MLFITKTIMTGGPKMMTYEFFNIRKTVGGLAAGSKYSTWKTTSGKSAAKLKRIDRVMNTYDNW